MQKRTEIEDKYKWKFETFQTNEEIEQVFLDLDYLTKTLQSYKGKFNNPDMFFEFHNKYKDKILNVEKFGFYVGNVLNIDSSNTEMLKLSTRLNNAYSKYSKATAFATPQIEDLPEEYLKSLLNDPRAKDLDSEIKAIIESKPHRLNEQTTEIISSINKSFSNSSAVFDVMTDSEMPFDDAVDGKGEKHKVNDALYSALISSEDRVLRESSYNSLMNGYGRFNKTLAKLYIKDIETDTDFMRLRNYKSTLDEALFSESVPETVYYNNIKNVENNINLLQEYVKTLNKNSGLKDFAYFDLFEKNKLEKQITIEQAQETIKRALAPLGSEYLSMVERKFNDNSIDYMPCENKSSGGYCSNQYDAKTLILMNWNYNYDSMSTLAHEMGHCINAEYFNSAQPMEKAGITIFAAEIASTVNEILLNQYMLKTCKPEEKQGYLKQFLNNVRSTIFRQTLFSEFELFAHEKIENDIPLTYEDFNNKYYELNKKYYGDSCILPENLRFEWSRIPHFYNAYYVYSYSTGLITAISIASRILQDGSYADKYIKFLKNGVDKKAIDVLKEIDIDLTTDKPFIDAFDFIKKQLEEYKKI